MSIQPTDSNRFASLDYLSNETQTITPSSSVTTDAVSVGVTSSVVATSNSLSLTALGEQLDAASDVDWNQVSKIRQAIENGDLSVDLDSLSQSILEMHQS
nr:flagellar biosynthesis anti-sigma factor FlgM [uncultured Tolumonas sp.]